MKLTTEDIREKRNALCKVMLEIIRKRARADELKDILADDFAKNEAAYRAGIPTESGILLRKPKWEVTAKPCAMVE